MILKMCRKCKKPIVHPNVYCDKCLELVDKYRDELHKERESKYNKQRDPKFKKFYNSNDWRMLKEKKLQDEQYLCERCRKLATEVHHVKPIQTPEGWELRLVYSNLESLCVDCHNYRHGRFQRKKEVNNNGKIKTNSMR